MNSSAQVPRPWPEAVHALIAAQQRAVDGLLGAPEARTVVIDPRAAPRGRRRARRTAAPAVAGVLVAGLGVGGYLLWGPQDGAGVPDKYLKAPICAEAAGGLHLPADQRKPDKDWYVERSGTAETRCSWYGSSVVQGVRSEDRDPSATVQWELRRSAGNSENATKAQRDDFSAAAKDRQADAPGIGDEAYWDRPGTGETCALVVRDGNLRLWVRLGGEDHPEPDCKAQAAAVARAALAAMPR